MQASYKRRTLPATTVGDSPTTSAMRLHARFRPLLAATVAWCLACVACGRAEAGSVSVLVAGQFRGTTRTASELRRALLAPLEAAGFYVVLYSGGYAEDAAAWRAWGAAAAGDAHVFVEIPNQYATLGTSFWRNCAPGYHTQYGALAATWLGVSNRSAYTFVIRTRNDLLFPAVQAFKPCWLQELPQGVLLTTDIEIHQGDRWNQRGMEIRGSDAHLDYLPAFASFGLNLTTPRRMSSQPRFPTMTCDQFFAGQQADMKLLLSIDTAEPWQRPCPSNGHIENILAIFLFANGIDVYTVSLTPRRNDPASKDVGPVNWAPTPRPCFLCYDCFSHT